MTDEGKLLEKELIAARELLHTAHPIIEAGTQGKRTFGPGLLMAARKRQLALAFFVQKGLLHVDLHAGDPKQLAQWRAALERARQEFGRAFHAALASETTS